MWEGIGGQSKSEGKASRRGHSCECRVGPEFLRLGAGMPGLWLQLQGSHVVQFARECMPCVFLRGLVVHGAMPPGLPDPQIS